MGEWISVLEACVPILVALVGIIPTIRNNRKKTQETIKETQTQIKDLTAILEAHIKEDEYEKARNMRYRILRFFDEICEGRLHSESHYEDILDDCSDYAAFSKTHPDFRNNRGEIAMREIGETYKAIKRKGGFLTYKEE